MVFPLDNLLLLCNLIYPEQSTLKQVANSVNFQIFFVFFKPRARELHILGYG